MKKIISIILALCMALLLCSFKFLDYQKANKAYLNGDYEKAITLFEGLGNYKDSAEKKKEVEFSLSVKHPNIGFENDKAVVYLNSEKSIKLNVEPIEGLENFDAISNSNPEVVEAFFNNGNILLKALSLGESVLDISFKYGESCKLSIIVEEDPVVIAKRIELAESVATQLKKTTKNAFKYSKYEYDEQYNCMEFFFCAENLHKTLNSKSYTTILKYINNNYSIIKKAFTEKNFENVIVAVLVYEKNKLSSDYEIFTLDGETYTFQNFSLAARKCMDKDEFEKVFGKYVTDRIATLVPQKQECESKIKLLENEHKRTIASYNSQYSQYEELARADYVKYMMGQKNSYYDFGFSSSYSTICDRIQSLIDAENSNYSYFISEYNNLLSDINEELYALGYVD